MLRALIILLLSQPQTMPVADGIASYYTEESSGTVTASGEIMDDDLFTCAMRKGEFGTYYKITAENGKSVICRLNDRGPYVKGRVIDLSEAAMRALDPKAGLLEVEVEQIPAPYIELLLTSLRYAAGGAG